MSKYILLLLYFCVTYWTILLFQLTNKMKMNITLDVAEVGRESIVMIRSYEYV